MYRLRALVVLTTIAQPARADLVICNDTTAVQAVSVGYEEGGRPVSEGWWNVQPGACSLFIRDALTLDDHYFRAEVNGGEFDGEDYHFCTTPEAYTIVRPTDCGSRGYDSERFREIATGGSAAYTYRIAR